MTTAPWCSRNRARISAGRLLQDLRVLEDRAEDGEPRDREEGRQSEGGASEPGVARVGDASSGDALGAHDVVSCRVAVTGRGGAVPRERGVEGLVERGGGDTERGAEAGVVDDPAIRELVEGVQVLPFIAGRVAAFVEVGLADMVSTSGRPFGGP